MTMPAGKYYVGDLCYVLHSEWDECCDLFFRDRNGGCNQGEFNLSDGRRFASYNTMYGDGSYTDMNGRGYSVDAGLIGCILLSDIDLTNKDNFLQGGQIVDFDEEFTTSTYEGNISFGDLVIPTGEDECFDEEDYWEVED